MEALRETTVWSDTNTDCNHIYLFDGRFAVAYIKKGTSQPFWFKSGLPIDRRKRSFVRDDITKFNVVDVNTQQWTVEGSKGASYNVSYADKTWSCTCTGFSFRGKCRHIDTIKDAQ